MASIISAGTTSGTALNMAGDTSGVLELATNGSTTAVTIDTSQNVGIGTSSPVYKLDVVNNSNADLISHISNANAGSSARSALVFGNDISNTVSGLYQNSSTTTTLGGAGSLNLFIGTSNPLTFSTASTERMRIDSSGNLLVGTTTNTGNARAQFAFSSGNGIGIQNNIGSAANGMLFQYGASSVGSITINTTATSFNTSSDYRLKENITPMTGALDKVLQLKPVTYTWKQDGSDGQGFIAHELQEIVPDCVNETKDAVDEDGNPKYQGVDTSFLVATLTAAIQEQQTIINDLKARITALEGAA